MAERFLRVRHGIHSVAASPKFKKTKRGRVISVTGYRGSLL